MTAKLRIEIVKIVKMDKNCRFARREQKKKWISNIFTIIEKRKIGEDVTSGETNEESESQRTINRIT